MQLSNRIALSSRESVYDEETKIGTCDITTFDFKAGDKWRREDFTLRQTCHSMSAAQSMLFEAGFKT